MNISKNKFYLPIVFSCARDPKMTAYSWSKSIIVKKLFVVVLLAIIIIFKCFLLRWTSRYVALNPWKMYGWRFERIKFLKLIRGFTNETNRASEHSNLKFNYFWYKLRHWCIETKSRELLLVFFMKILRIESNVYITLIWKFITDHPVEPFPTEERRI